jgi:hypothetical protein
VVELVAVAVISVLLLACVAKGRGIKTWIVRLINPTYNARPTVMLTRPADFESNVALDAFVAVDVRLPNDGRVIDMHSLPPEKPDTVRLVRTGDRRPVPAHVNTTGGGDAIVLKPMEPLEPNTQYSFELTPGVTDTAGAAFVYFSARFTTAAASKPERFDAAFERVALPTTGGEQCTCVAMGPDGKLYAAALDGRILRFDIAPDGTLGKPEAFATMLANNGGPRLVTGFCFDPKSTADNLIIWASHGQLSIERSADWSGKISRLAGAKLEQYRDAVINLPRGVKDHLNNQPAFGPDGALYFCQASNTAMGAPDHKWGWRPERLLSASLLRLDVTKLPADKPLDAKTEEGGAYDPYKPDSALTMYATGIRNGYDLLFHSNGRLYAPINGSAAGGNAPGSSDPRAKAARRFDTGQSYAGPDVPSLNNINLTEDDTLLTMEKGAYYGHPNPLRAEFVLNGGNPTAGPDPHEIPLYPVGVKPDTNYRFAAFNFGKNLAPCGIIEYKHPGPLAGRLLIARYSGGDDVIVLNPAGPNGAVSEALTGINGLTGLVDPLDLVEDTRNGNLYVSEWNAKCITLLRAVPNGVSPKVYRQVVEPQSHPSNVN